MRLETYLDAYAKAYHEFEDGELDTYRLMRQRDKFRQRIIDGYRKLPDYDIYMGQGWKYSASYNPVTGEIISTRLLEERHVPSSE